MTEKAKDMLAYLRERGWMGEAGIAFILGVLVAAYLRMSGVTDVLWGVPLPLVYGGAVASGAFLLTASLRLIPSRRE